jgi:3-hydroxyacyl-CoA dehydrogenase
LQGALLREAWALHEDGIASIADIDRTVSEGLGLRWSFMGPFETVDLNAPGGIADYARRLAPLYARIASSRADHAPWSSSAVANAERERREALSADDLEKRAAWRDRRLMDLARWKRDA